MDADAPPPATATGAGADARTRLPNRPGGDAWTNAAARFACRCEDDDEVAKRGTGAAAFTRYCGRKESCVDDACVGAAVAAATLCGALT